MSRSGVVVAGLLACAAAAPGAAQVTLRGRVLDAQTGQPVAGAAVILLGHDSLPAGRAQSGADGAYLVRVPGPGTFVLEAQRVGYRKLSVAEFELREADAVRDLRLHPVPFQLEPVEVVAERERVAFLTSVGFYDRQKSDFGRFIDRTQIEQRRARRFTDLLRMIPGVQLVSSAGGLARASVRLRGSRLSDGGQCHPRVYVDGLIVIRGDARAPGAERVSGDPLATEREQLEGNRDEIALDDVAMPDDVAAIEVYRSSSQVPAQFGGMSPATQCGVIVIWTRRGGRPER